MEEESRPTKRPKTIHEEERKDYKYRQMLVRVARHLDREQVRKLATIGGLSSAERDEILQKQEGWPDILLEKLELRGIIAPDNVSWLTENLKVLQHDVALGIVEEYSLSETFGDIPEEPGSDDSDASNWQVSTFEDFLTDIHLQNEYPQKLTLNGFLEVKDQIDPQDLVGSFWQRLTSLDYRAGFPQNFVSKAFSMRDFIFGVLHCADDFLRQDILEKMSACQLAVPMVLQGVPGKPPEFLLWALRGVMKKWKGKRDSCALEQPIVSYPVFMVSVLRIGDVRISKSQLLNTMLSYSQGNTPHDYFLSMEKDFVKPFVSVGSIECAWFLPHRDNETEIFPEITLFLNLRGDCKNYQTQTEFACRAADLTITLVTTEKRKSSENLKHINKIRKFSKRTLFVSIRGEDKTSIRPQKVHNPEIRDGWLFVKVLQRDVLSRKICEQIALLENIPGEWKSFDSLGELCGNDIRLDEHKSSCEKAKEQVLKLFKSFKAGTVQELKEECFPLQRILKDWVQIDKERFEVTNDQSESFELQRRTIRTRKRRKREEQMQTGFSNTIREYHDMIDSHKYDPESLRYLFTFMQEKIYKLVNDNTQKDMNKLSELEREIKLHVKQTKESQSDDRTSLGEATKSSYQELVESYNLLYKSFRLKNLGCEHFLRELGQLYEAFEEIKSLKENPIDRFDITLLPSLAARLVVESHSFELMDGDSGSVPLVWITRVLDSLTSHLGDPRIVVISVIGVQSSGKSTLLNSMFGLRFPVRAGRCTRGLFFRLLKLDETLAKELGFSYLVVVDTEGIRSIDHDDRRFDNELVTLALSIANITIFNIEGENISPDMTGILQIAAHALMRMKEVDLECHCRIVQQRVSDLTAAERNKANTNRIMETLDMATRVAAEEEGLQGRYKKFTDVVNLQVDESLQYIPCLWTGGMSPPNYRYSDTVSKLKAKILQDLREKEIIPNLTLSHFTERVRDVWRAVKEEDFLFNFQDSVRAVAFNQLCLEYNKWIVQMRQRMMRFSTTRFVLLDGKTEAVRSTWVQFELFEAMDDITATITDFEEYKECIHTTAEEERDKLLTLIEGYVTNHPRKHSIYVHKQSFINDAKLVIKDVEHQALARANDEYELQQVQSDLPNLQRKWRYKLTLEVKQRAMMLRNSGVKSMTTSEFDFVWNECVEMVNNDMKRTKATSPVTCLRTVCEKLLLRVTSDLAIGSEVRSLFKNEGGIDNHADLNDCSRYVHEKFVKAWLMEERSQISDTDREQSQVELESEAVEDVVQHVESIVAKNLLVFKRESLKGFDENAYQLMLQKTLNDLTSTKGTFRPPNTLIAKGLLYLSCAALRHFLAVQKEYGHPCTVWLLPDKDKMFEDFNAFLSNDAKRIAERCADFLHHLVLPKYRQKIECAAHNAMKRIKLPQYEPEEDTPWSFLRDLADHPFQLIIPDLHRPMTDVIQRRHCLERQGDNAEINEMITKVVEATLGTIGRRIQALPSHTNLQDWLNGLELGNINISPHNVSEMFDSPCVKSVITHLRHLSRMGVTSIVREAIHFHLLQLQPQRSRFCYMNCPKCGVPCDNVEGHHNDHFSFLHRPRGFKGGEHEDGRLVIDDCITLARQSKLDRHDREIPGWTILPCSDNPGIKFWHWVMATHNNKLADILNGKEADIPSDWHDITKEEAIKSLYIDETTKLEGRFAAATEAAMPRQSESDESEQLPRASDDMPLKV